MDKAIVQIHICHSAQWLKQKRLETGTNWPVTICADVDASTLSLTARALLLEMGSDEYPKCVLFVGYNARCEPKSQPIYGRKFIVIDKEQPTAENIDECLNDIAHYLEAERAELGRLEFERAKLEQRKADARELLKDEISARNAQIDQMQGDISAYIDEIHSLRVQIDNLEMEVENSKT